MNRTKAINAAVVQATEASEPTYVVKLPYSDIHIVVSDKAYVEAHLPGAIIVETINPINYDANDVMVNYMEEIGQAVLDQYCSDRREYASEEVYNYWILRGRLAILKEISGWFENEIARLEDGDTSGDEEECEHHDYPETCEECQRAAAIIKEYARFRDSSYDGGGMVPIPDGVLALISDSVIRCACDAEVGEEGRCRTCNVIACLDCHKGHGPGKCGGDSK